MCKVYINCHAYWSHRFNVSHIHIRFACPEKLQPTMVSRYAYTHLVWNAQTALSHIRIHTWFMCYLQHGSVFHVENNVMYAATPMKSTINVQTLRKANTFVVVSYFIYVIQHNVYNPSCTSTSKCRNPLTLMNSSSRSQRDNTFNAMGYYIQT